MRFAYADPPYLGLAKTMYGRLYPRAGDYDTLEAHQALIDRLCTEFTDGWALSLHTPSLRAILPMCPPDVRVGAWVKPFASFKPGVNPAYAWEPVIFRGGRKRTRWEPKAVDWVAANITMERNTPGAKPDGFCFWVFQILNAQSCDSLEDLFPGSGAVTIAWEQWKRTPALPMTGKRPHRIAASGPLLEGS